MPAVTDEPSPNGLPAASTQSPICTSWLRPQVTKASLWSVLTWITAMSVSSSEPSTLAGSSVPSENDTVMLSAWPTTWLWVTITPEGSITKPDPAPSICSRWVRMRSRNCFSNGVPRSAAGTFSLASAAASSTSCVTAMLTTAGTTRRTSGAKVSGPLCTSTGFSSAWAADAGAAMAAHNNRTAAAAGHRGRRKGPGSVMQPGSSGDRRAS